MKEVVDKIRAAEKKAAELKAEAVSEAEYNLKKVREKGKKYVDDTVASAGRSAALMIKQAEEETAEAAAEKIKEAEIDEIAEVKGVNRELAQKIKDELMNN